MTPDTQSVDPRPRPAFAIGISGYRNAGVEDPVANAVAAALADVVARLTHEVKFPRSMHIQFKSFIVTTAKAGSPLRLRCKICFGFQMSRIRSSQRVGLDVVVDRREAPPS
jgi:hypothetical protein